MSMKYALAFTVALWLSSEANSQIEEPRIVVHPTSQCANQTSFLSLTCIAYVGRETSYQPTTITWYNGANEQLANSSHVNIHSNVVVIDGLVFIESTLEARTVYSHLTGQSSCVVSNVIGQDRASWILMYESQPPVTVIMKPSSQIVNYTSTIRMTCLALVHEELASDTIITWWGEFGQITNNTETVIYTSRISSGDLLFVESLLEICSANYVHIGELSCVAENSLGRDIANWTVEPPVKYPPPRLTLTQNNVQLNYGEMVNATCSASVGPWEAYSIDTLEIMWLDANGQQIIAISNQTDIHTEMFVIDGNVFITLTLEIDSLGHQYLGDLQCTARSIFGTESANFTIQIYEILTSPQLILTPLDQSVDCRSRVTLTCVINAFPIPDVQWYFNGASVDNTASNNVNINKYHGSAIGLNFTEAYLDICDFNDENVGYYWCSALNMFGNYTSDPVLIEIDPQSAPQVTPPVVTTADRISNTEAVVTLNFETHSVGNFEVAFYTANDSTTPYLNEKFRSILVTIDQPQAKARDLNTCSRYWVVVTARYCGVSGSTEPRIIGLHESNPYELVLMLGDKDEPCKSWIMKDQETKAADMEAVITSRSSDCGFEIILSCFENSTWNCTADNPLKVTFKTQIVGYSKETVGDIKKCIDNWIIAGKAIGQSLTLGGSNLTVINFEEPAMPVVSQSLPVWLWVVVIVGAVLLVCFIAAIVMVIIVSRHKSHTSAYKKEWLVSHSKEEQGNTGENDYTVAVVDNPLYAENEGEVDAYMKEELGEDDEELEVHEEDFTKTDI